MSSQIQKRQLQLPAPVILPTDLKTMIAALRSTHHNLLDLSRCACTLREQHQADKAEAIAISDNIGTKAALEWLQWAEATKEMFQRLPCPKAAPTGRLFQFWHAPGVLGEKNHK